MAESTQRSGSRLVALCWDANDPLRLARFWAEALRTEVDATDGGTSLVTTDDGGLRTRTSPSRSRRPARTRVHLDLTTSTLDDQTETVERLIRLGARHIDIGQRPDDLHVVLADPEGNELCVIEPTNSFLAGHGRLGSITCDGSRAVGVFWSAVLGWPLTWDQDGETAIHTPDGRGPFITWGPPVPPKSAKNRLHLHIAPNAEDGQAAEASSGWYALGGRRGTGSVPGTATRPGSCWPIPTATRSSACCPADRRRTRHAPGSGVAADAADVVGPVERVPVGSRA